MRRLAATLLWLAGCAEGAPAARSDAGPADAGPGLPDAGEDAGATDAGPCGDEVPSHALRAEAWPEADALFHADVAWLGADDAYSVDLGGGRVLWLFADTFISTSPARMRIESTMIRNSVGVQDGTDPTTAAMSFAWRGDAVSPTSYFAEDGAEWFWPGDGVVVDGVLVVFLMRVHASGDGWFEAFDWDAVRVENPTDAPIDWTLEVLATPPNDFGVVVGSASVFEHDGWVYAFGSDETGGHDMYVVRFRSGDVARGDLERPEWWCGAAGWVAQGAPGLDPVPAFGGGQTELSVDLDCAHGPWIEIQTIGFGGTDLGVRFADRLVGPWTEPEVFFRPPESDRPDVLVYAGKAHPEQTGADLAVTYVANHTDFATLLADESLYYPRFVRLTWE